ncbi:MAG TPA: acyl-CoA thioesterase domain-containing protein [Acidimicrobiia bacterium]|nr:acyl-CoA thioesterase domain-containing protein [Acidimicrobiia bacterium]
MSAAAPQWATATDMAAVLDLEPIDRDLFRAVNTVAELRTTLYGGQVAAQALRAAALTVDADRYPHSLHGYFLRPGRFDLPVILHVDRDRDGRSFTARHVTAVQDGEVIFSMIASFQREESGGTLDRLPHEPAPVPDAKGRADWAGLLDITEVTETDPRRPRARHTDKLWVRVASPLPDDRVVHACALTYVSDLGSGFGQLDDPELPAGGPSIDHALWFHDPVRVDDWVLIEMWPDKAGGGRGVYQGTVRDRDGRLGAMLAQEMRLRRPGT